MLTTYLILLLTVPTSLFVLGLLVYLNNPKSATNRLFFLMALASSLSAVGVFASKLVADSETVFFWVKFTMMAASFASPLILLFILNFPEEKLKINRYLLGGDLALALFLFFSAIFNLLFKGAHYVQGAVTVEPGPVMPLFGGIFIVHLGIIIFWLIKKILHTEGREREQFRYLMLGFIAMLIPVGFFDVFLVAVYKNTNFVPLGVASFILLEGSIFYTITKHRFLDIRLVVARTVAYTLLITIFAAFYTVSIFWISRSFLAESVSSNQALISAFLALFIAFTFQPLKNFLEKVTEKIFFKTGYNSNELLSRLTKVMASTLNLEDLTKQTLHDLLNTMHIAHGTFLIFDNGNIYPPVYEGFSSQPHYDIETIKRLSDLKRIVVFEEENDESIKDLMRQFDFSLSLPLYVGDKLHGLLVLGEKKSGDIYSTQDFEVLGIFGPEISVAVQNAKAYEEIRRFNVTLKQEVEKETKQLKDLTEQQKDQVDIMGHEVKTPLTAISQQLNLLLDMILTEEKRKEWLKGNIQLEDAKRVVEGLIKMRAAETQEESIVTNMVEAARLDKLRFELNYSTFDLIELVQMAIKDSEERLETNKQEGKVTLQTELKNLEVEADQTRIKQCVDGLLTNAEKYGRNPTTHTLDVNVTVATDNGTVSISVHDQGMGIDQNDMEKLGKKFSRLDPHTNGSKLPRPGGSGLGLYTYKGIIEHHQGQLIIESEGLGKGSTFTLKLPSKRPQ
ncbi:ATP-binding protein [Patescibacteria group bacterium]|nr:ATP-binding protein [Patescibacteria group bacterium]